MAHSGPVSNDQPAFLGTVEACARLGVDRSTLTRWVASGRIKPAAKLPSRNGALFYDEAEVERLRAELAGVAQASSSAGAA